MRQALHVALGILAYILRLEGVKPLLMEFYRSRGMDEEAAQTHLDRLAGAAFVMTALACVMAMALGYLVSQAYPGTSAGAAGSWLMFTGMVIGAFQFKKRPAGMKMTLKDVREALKR